MTVDCKISFYIGNFKTKDIISLMNTIHNEFIKEILFTSSVLIDKGITIVYINDIDNYLRTIGTNREEIKDSFFHHINFDNDQTMIKSVLNILSTEESMKLDKQIHNDTKLILKNKIFKNLIKFIIQYLFRIDLKIKSSTECMKESRMICNNWFDYEKCPVYAYSLTAIIIFIIVYIFTMYMK